MKRQLVTAGTVLATAALTASAALAPAAQAKAQKLSFYEVTRSNHFYNGSGQPIAFPSSGPAAGDSFDETDDDYAGTFKHHAKRYSATDHIACTFESSSTGSCDAQFAIAGSLLIFNHVTADFQAGSFTLPLSEGTGQFSGAQGTLTVTSLPNGNSDLAMKIS